jgi:hypothetical protein
MASETIEERLSDLEKRVHKIEDKFGNASNADPPWWRKIAGRFKNNPEFDEAMRLGKEYRESLRPSETD